MSLQTGQIYHIFNRGVDKRNIFQDYYDFGRFIKSMREFNSVNPIGSLYEKKIREYKMQGRDIGNPLWISDIHDDRGGSLIKILSYCLLKNHFHFLIEQMTEGGIPEFMKRLGIGYTKYFNQKYNRSGSLFQGKYKILEVNDYGHFLKLAVYVNCNSEVHKICSAESWPWSSYSDYIGKRKGTMCNEELILEEFGSRRNFHNFCFETLPDIISIKEDKKEYLE